MRKKNAGSVLRRQRFSRRAGYDLETLEIRRLLSGYTLVFTTPPTSTTVGAYIDSPTGLQVTVENSSGQAVSGNTDEISISLGANPSGGALNYTYSDAFATNGVVTISNVAVNKAGAGYKLIATDLTNSAITSATSPTFSITTAYQFTDLVSFNNSGTSPYSPAAGLISDGNGDLFGTTSYGGQYGDGSVYELSGSNYSNFSTLVSFSGTTGSYLGDAPRNLAFDASKNLYGTTLTGGTANDGTVFELSGSKHLTFTSLVSFTGTSGNVPGAYPGTTLTLDGSGDIFGATSTGGTNNDGTVFELSGASHSVFRSLVSFTGTAGAYPGLAANSAPVLDSQGNLYGETGNGGASSSGTIYELSGTNYSTFKSLVAFTNEAATAAGQYPQGGLVIDGNGNVFGTTENGGVGNSYGSVFELSGSTHSTFKTLVTFTGTSGSYPGYEPIAGLTFDSNGNLYGTTEYGGTFSDGTVFELSGANYTTFTSLISMTYSTGSYTASNLFGGITLDGNGNLFGTGFYGGASGLGDVYELSPLPVPAKLAFSSPPTNSVVGASINSPAGFQVSVESSTGQLVSNSSDAITISLTGNPSGATASGTLTETAVNGVAAFYNVSLNLAGSGYSFTATDGTNPALTAATSSSFVVGSTSTAVGAGTTTLSPNSTGHSVLVTGNVSITGSADNWVGKLDITNNDIDIVSGSLTTVTNQAKQGYANGAWAGSGIDSSTANADKKFLTAVGVIQNNQSGTPLFTAANPLDGSVPGAADILVKYTFYGDTNLSGNVDGSDYNRIDNGMLTHATGWFNGDFNYDGVINGSDYTLIDNAYNTQGASLAAQIATPAASGATNGHLTQRATSLFSQLQIASPSAGFAVDSESPSVSVAAGIFMPPADDLLAKHENSRIGIYGSIEPGL